MSSYVEPKRPTPWGPILDLTPVPPDPPDPPDPQEPDMPVSLPNDAQMVNALRRIHIEGYCGELMRAGGIFEAPDPAASQIRDPRSGDVIDDYSLSVWTGRYVAYFVGYTGTGDRHEYAIRAVITDLHNSDEARQKRGETGGGGGSTVTRRKGHTFAHGEAWADETGFYTPIDISMLYGGADGVDPRALMDQAAALGFDGGRIFGGRLVASPERPQTQRPEAMPARMDERAKWLDSRDMELHPVLITDSDDPWDFNAHVQHHAVIARQNVNIRVLELVNELGHDTQRPWTTDELRDLEHLVREAGYDRALTAGAGPHDELMPPASWGDELMDGADSGDLVYPPAEVGNVSSTHYDRGRWPFYVNVAHGANEARMIGEQYDRSRLSGEPGRQDHPDAMRTASGGSDPRWAVGYAYLLGLSATGFNTRTVYHCSQARDCQVLTGGQLEGAQAIIRGSRVLPRGRFDFYNANNTGAWPASPIKSAAFVEGPASNNDKTVWRAWSFRHAETGQWFAVLSGPSVDRPGLVFQNGFSLDQQVDRFDNLVHVFTLRQA